MALPFTVYKTAQAFMLWFENEYLPAAAYTHTSSLLNFGKFYSIRKEGELIAELKVVAAGYDPPISHCQIMLPLLLLPDVDLRAAEEIRKTQIEEQHYAMKHWDWSYNRRIIDFAYEFFPSISSFAWFEYETWVGRDRYFRADLLTQEFWLMDIYKEYEPYIFIKEDLATWEVKPVNLSPKQEKTEKVEISTPEKILQSLDLPPFHFHFTHNIAVAPAEVNQNVTNVNTIAIEQAANKKTVRKRQRVYSAVRAIKAQKMMDEEKINQAEAARRISVSPSTLSRDLDYLDQLKESQTQEDKEILRKAYQETNNK